jgi:hypothetical protein
MWRKSRNRDTYEPDYADNNTGEEEVVGEIDTLKRKYDENDEELEDVETGDQKYIESNKTPKLNPEEKANLNAAALVQVIMSLNY